MRVLATTLIVMAVLLMFVPIVNFNRGFQFVNQKCESEVLMKTCEATFRQFGAFQRIYVRMILRSSGRLTQEYSRNREQWKTITDIEAWK